jgi:hypothetical protein
MRNIVIEIITNLEEEDLLEYVENRGKRIHYPRRVIDDHRNE